MKILKFLDKNENFLIKILMYVSIIILISAVSFMPNIFKKYAYETFKVSNSVDIISYWVNIYLTLSIIFISFTILIKKGFKNLDKISDHGIIWYLGFLFINTILFSSISSLMLSIIVIIIQSTPNILYILFLKHLIFVTPISLGIGFVIGLIFGLIYEFRKGE